MKKILALFLLLSVVSNSAFAGTIWADDSVNDMIIKKYNANALNEEFLPALPESLKRESEEDYTPTPPISSNSKPISNTQSKPQNTYQPSLTRTKVDTTRPRSKSNNYAIIKKGTKFRLSLDASISDNIPVGTKVYFTNLYPETNKFVSIPAGTKFIGTVEDAHMPQIGGNGGLLVINIKDFIYKGRKYPVEAKVIMVGKKRIYRNNIKGKQKYFQNVANSTTPGVKFYKKSWNITKKFAGDGLEVILTPITFIGGVAVLAGNIVVSPVVGAFKKGGRIIIEEDTRFQIKLIEDTAVYI